MWPRRVLIFQYLYIVQKGPMRASVPIFWYFIAELKEYSPQPVLLRELFMLSLLSWVARPAPATAKYFLRKENK